MAKQRVLWVLLTVAVGACLGSQLIGKTFDSMETDAKGRVVGIGNPATDDDFSCRILVYRERIYAVNEPIWVTIKLQHQLKQDLILRDDMRHNDVFSFDIEDKHNNKIPLRQTLTKNPTLGYNRIEPGRIAEAMIDIADWYDFSEVGEYSVNVKWELSSEGKYYSGQSETINIKIVTKADKEIFDLIRRATRMSCSGLSENVAKLKLVEIGGEAVPVLLDWLKMEKRGEVPRDEPYMQHAVFDILSEIGVPETREIIANSDTVITKDDRIGDSYKTHLLRQRDIWLKRIDIWQSDDRYNNLIKALDEFKPGKKWVIFKLGVLGDKRAVPFLEKIAQENRQLDIRETAKDALTHLKDPNIPMRYILHRASEKVALTTSTDTYRIGEPIRINCKIKGGEYGSHKLVEFSRPAWHFLPWGRMGADERCGSPFRFMMKNKDWGRRKPAMMMPMRERPGESEATRNKGQSRRPERLKHPKGITRHGRLIPVKELKSMKRRSESRREEPLKGYIDLSELECKGGFVLQLGENRCYTLEDLNSAFQITEPGEYEIYVYTPGKGPIHVSNTITITISPQE